MIRITTGLIGILGTMIVAGSLSARSGWWVATPSDDDTVIVLADQDTSNITRGEDGEVQMKYLPELYISTLPRRRAPSGSFPLQIM